MSSFIWLLFIRLSILLFTVVLLYNLAFYHFRVRINQLEAELACRDQELQAQKHQLCQLQKELEAKTSQIDKLQDAIGYTNDLARAAPHCRRFSVINQGPSQFHRVAVEVHRRFKAKEGVSAEPNSGTFWQEVKAAHVSKAIHKTTR